MVANGHRLEEVLGWYTIDQVQLFSLHVGRRQLNEYRQLAILHRNAAHADQKGWDKFTRSLKPRDAQKPGEAPADSLVRQLKASGLWRSLKTSQ